MWINVHMNHFRHGVMLEDLPSRCATWRSTSCAPRCRHAATTRPARSCASTNCSPSSPATTTRSVSGRTSCRSSATPGRRRAVGLAVRRPPPVLNAVVFDGRIVMTPTFMGAEPRRIGSGHLAGMSLFDPEESTRARPDPLARRRRSASGRSSTRRSIPTSISPQLAEPVRRPDAGRRVPRQPRRRRIRASPGADDDRRPAPGAAGADGARTSAGGRRHAEVGMAEVVRHLDETWFSWYGGFDDDDAVLLPGPQPGDPDRVRPSPRRRVRQRGADPQPRAHRRAHTQRRRLRRRPPTPAPRAVRPHPRHPPPARVTVRGYRKYVPAHETSATAAVVMRTRPPPRRRPRWRRRCCLRCAGRRGR